MNERELALAEERVMAGIVGEMLEDAAVGRIDDIRDSLEDQLPYIAGAARVLQGMISKGELLINMQESEKNSVFLLKGEGAPSRLVFSSNFIGGYLGFSRGVGNADIVYRQLRHAFIGNVPRMVISLANTQA